MKKILPFKLKNLILLKKKGYNVPNFIYFNSIEIFNEKNLRLILNFIKKNKKIIIRSASALEDNKDYTAAGKYESVVSNNNINDIKKNIQIVINSFKRKSSKDFLIVQKYFDKSHINGVVFNSDPKNSLDYLIINYTKSKLTNIITSGSKNENYFVFDNSYSLKKITNKYFKTIILNTHNLKNEFDFKDIDVEFAITKNFKFIVFQLRALKRKIPKQIDNSLIRILNKKLKKMFTEKYLTNGEQEIYSTMTDWNPAEIIGLKPKPLAVSLYKEIITNNVWAESRKEMGYEDMTGNELLFEYLGTPYISVRNSLNSFLPKNLPLNLQKKIIKFYQKKFLKNPFNNHDKVESEIVISSLDFLIEDKLKNLKKILDKKEIKFFKVELINLTREIFNIFKKDKLRIKNFNKEFKKIKKIKTHPINKINLLINFCKSYGTIKFANFARMGFIAKNFLDTMCEKGIINKHDKNSFVEKNKSITKELNNVIAKKDISKFFSEYGHLRPNTYDITSQSYKEIYSKILKNKNLRIIKDKKFEFNKNQKNNINSFIKKYKLQISFYEFEEFLGESIYLREKSKLYFTKCIEEIFFELKKLSKTLNISNLELSYLDISIIKSLYNNFINKKIKITLIENIRTNKIVFNQNKNIRLPNVITNPQDVHFYEEKAILPTFTGTKKISGKIVEIQNSELSISIKDKIVMIKNADPGFDFIFMKKIKGLITAFGGPNSHMFIRCNELNIPAIIGVGEKQYNNMLNKKYMTIDPNERKFSFYEL